MYESPCSAIDFCSIHRSFSSMADHHIKTTTFGMRYCGSSKAILFCNSRAWHDRHMLVAYTNIHNRASQLMETYTFSYGLGAVQS